MIGMYGLEMVARARIELATIFSRMLHQLSYPATRGACAQREHTGRDETEMIPRGGCRQTAGLREYCRVTECVHVQGDQTNASIALFVFQLRGRVSKALASAWSSKWTRVLLRGRRIDAAQRFMVPGAPRAYALGQNSCVRYAARRRAPYGR